ncbi:MAG: GNAT family N-acetyltransferase [Thermomicrobiales bacterium]
MTHEGDIFGPAAPVPPGMPFDQAALRAVTITRAGLRDLQAVARLQRRAFRPPLAYGLTTLIVLWFLPRVYFLIAREGGHIVGCAIGDRQGGQARVINLCVDPAARRRGVGTKLLRSLEVLMPKGHVVLMVEERNEVAQALYRREGYLPVGKGQDYYGRGHHGIWMQKKRGEGEAEKVWV